MKKFKPFLRSSYGWGFGFSLQALAAVLLATAAPATAQVQQTTPVSSTPTATAAMLASPGSGTHSGSAAGISTSDDRYRIGPGDVLDIRVFNRPQLSREAARVDGRGLITMPLIESEIRASCRTEIELAQEIQTRYLKYQRNPQVNVFVKEYNSKPVAVIGAVNAPGRFQLQRQVKLLELLTFAGGPAQRVGRSVQIVHTQPALDCQMPDEDSPATATGIATPPEGEDLTSVKLNDILSGDERANPYVRPGDIVTLLEADQVYVVGNVLRPSAIPLKEPITLSQAIAMSGGTMPDTKTDKVRIVRQTPSGKTEMFANLKAIDRRQAEDIVLQANDIVDVPTSSGKRLLRSLVGAIVPSVGRLPVRVIP